MNKEIKVGLVCLMLFGCVSNLEKKAGVGDGSFTERFEIQNCMISLDSLTLNRYERGIVALHNDTNFIFAAYNRLTHAIDWFDVTNNRVYHRIVLDKHGPHGIMDQVNGIYIHTFDSIILNDGVFIYLINKSGEVIKKNRNYFETEMGTAYMVNTLTSGLHYNSSRHSLISEVLIPGNRKVFFGEIDLKHELFYLHQGETPDCFSKTDRQRHFLNVSFKGDSVIYNTSCSSDIYVYDTGNKKTTVFNGKSSLSRNNVPQMISDNPDALWRHIIENPRFFQVVYSHADKYFYRLHWKEAVYQSGQHNQNSAYNKPVVLSVFSEDFELLYETILPEHLYLVDYLLPTAQGVMLNASHPQNSTYEENKKELHVISFKN